MQVALDVLRVLFFPGLIFMAACGYILFLVEGRLNAAFYGGRPPPLRPFALERSPGAGLPPGRIIAWVTALTAMGAAGVLLVGIKGDLLTLALLLSAAEILPIAVAARSGPERSLLPLRLRGALARLISLFLVLVTVSLRFPGEFAAGLDGFRGEGCFNALQLWSGYESGLFLAALILAGAAFFFFHLEIHPLLTSSDSHPPGFLERGFLLLVESAERTAAVILFMVVFIGYPWEGAGGLAVWTGSALAIVTALVAARTWAGGRVPATLRRWRRAGSLMALLAITLALAAVA